ncbi:MAG: glycerate kinase [Kineosporiaceae bacterium]|nr:glycerate kinase [Kineosporiaceae bacterium]
MAHFVVAMDKFKGSLGSREAGEAVAAGLSASSDTPVQVIEIADGGDGLVGALATAGLSIEQLEVDGTPIDVATFGAEVVIESAQLVGLVRGGVRVIDPLGASSEPVGRAIRALLAGPRPPQRVIVGVGGTNCTDGGLGLLRGLGARALDEHGEPVPPGGAGLSRLARIDTTTLDDAVRPELPGHTELIFATDVTVPLLGPSGAARMFSPQKGAAPEEVEVLEAGLERLAAVLDRMAGTGPADSVGLIAGSGAGGGMPACALALLDARITAGADLVLTAAGVPSSLGDARLVITGEGAIDRQTSHGKAPGRVVRLAEAAGVPVVLIGGRVDRAAVADLGPAVAAWYSLADLSQDLGDSMLHAAEHLEAVGRIIGRAF